MKTIEHMEKKATLPSSSKTVRKPRTSIYDIEIDNLEGSPLDFSAFKGKHILVVNVASKCGFTGQYKSLQSLSEKYGDDLVVVGVPCNQFGQQEPGDAADIRSFCDLRYGVTFPLTQKIEVKGPGQHPLYQWLTKKSLNGKKNSTVRWNFQKYLLDKEGQLVEVFYSITSPLSRKIIRRLQ